MGIGPPPFVLVMMGGMIRLVAVVVLVVGGGVVVGKALDNGPKPRVQVEQVEGTGGVCALGTSCR
jgi:hypothetical protein